MTDTLKVTIEIPFDYWRIQETLDFFLDIATYQSYGKSGRAANHAASVFRQILNEAEEQIKKGGADEQEGPREV